LFDKIGIDADKLLHGVMPDGTEVGGGGFFATTEDNLRLMQLYHNAAFGRERILSSEYVRLATSKQIDTASEAIGNPPALDNFVATGSKSGCAVTRLLPRGTALSGSIPSCTPGWT
jgi:CubicO group peptidase (beta-lactamase class C family)